MPAVYSTLFLVAHAGATVDETVPAGYRFVVRGITAFNANAISDQPVQLIYLGASVTVYQRSLGPQVWFGDEIRLVLNPLDTLRAVTGPDCDLTVSGYLLKLP